MIEIVPATLWHARDIIQKLRKHEREAIFVYAEQSPEHFIAQHIAVSFYCYAGLKDGEVGALWGAYTSGPFSDEAYIWMIGTDLIADNKVAFLRHSIQEMKRLKGLFKKIRGHVVCDFDASVKWLKWLGFEVKDGSPLREFSYG